MLTTSASAYEEDDNRFVTDALPHLLRIIGGDDNSCAQLAMEVLCDFASEDEFEDLLLSFGALHCAIEALPKKMEQENVVTVLLTLWNDKKQQSCLPNDTLEFIVAFLRRSKKILVDHIAAVEVLCRDKGLRLMLANAGAIPLLEHVISHGSQEQVRLAATALWNLSANASITPIILSSKIIPAVLDTLVKLQETNNLLTAIDVAGSVPTLAQILRHGRGKIQSRAVELLGTIIEYSRWTKNYKRLLDTELLPLLIEFLCHGGQNRSHSLTLLKSASCLTTNTFPIVSAGGLGPLIEVIRDGKPAQRNIAATLLEEALSAITQIFPSVTAEEIEVLTSFTRKCEDTIKGCCLQVLAYLAENQKNVRKILSTNIVSTASSVLRDADPVSRNSSVKLLLSLSVIYEGRSAIAESGVIKDLVQMIDKNSNETVISTLTRLARHSLENKTAIAANGGIELLIPLIQSSNDKLRELALLALIALSINSYDNKQKIAAAGTVATLVWILQHEDGGMKHTIKCRTMTLLKSLAVDPIIERLVVAAGAVHPIVILILDSDNDTAWIAMTALQNLAVASTHKKAIGATDGCIEALLSRMGGTNDKLSIAALNTLMNLALRCRRNKKSILAKGKATLFVQAFRESTDGQKRLHVLSVLSELAVDKASKKQIISTGFLSDLAMITNEGELDEVEREAGALFRLLY